MKKFGFTLAETLITLGIVGVVAALTIPSLVTDNQKKICANSLSAAVSNFENAMTTIIMKDNVTNMFETNAWKALNGSPLSEDNMDDFVRYVNDTFTVVNFGKKVVNFYPNNLKSVDGNEVDKSSVMTEELSLEAKNGAVYFISIKDPKKDPNGKKDLEIMEKGGNYSKKAATVYVDVNGKDKPNTIGRDIFQFDLGADGFLYSAGGTDFSIYIDGTTKHTWDAKNSDYICKDSSYAKHGFGCTTRLIDKKYTFDY